MAEYKCFHCGKTVAMDYLRKRIRCPYCNSKVLYKERVRATKVSAL